MARVPNPARATRGGAFYEFRLIPTNVGVFQNAKACQFHPLPTRAQLEVQAEAADYTLIVSPSDTGEKLAATVMVETDYPVDAPKSYPVYVRIK